MGQKGKTLRRLVALPKDMKFEGLVTILRYFQHEINNKGKTSGSRVQFKRDGYPSIRIHKPHDGKPVWKLDFEEIVKLLKEVKLL